MRKHVRVRAQGGKENWGDRTYGSVAGFEAVEALFAVRVGLCWYDGFDGFFGNLPELVVFFAHEQDYTGALGVEAAWDMEDGGANDFFDPGLGDWDLLVQTVNRAARHHGVEEWLGIA